MPAIESSGIRIAYDDLGRGASGAPTLLCLHGWCQTREFLGPLAQRLCERHRVLNVDLRGHGDSGGAGADFTTADVVADLTAVVDAAGADRVVPICLANAGWFALEMARARPARLPRMVSLTWALCDLPPFFRAALDGMQDPDDWEEVRDMFFGMWFQLADPRVVSWARARMARFDFAAWARCGREVAASFSGARSLARLIDSLPVALPVLHLFSRPGLPDEFLATHRREVNDKPWYQERLFDQPWAFPSYEAPDQVAVAVERFLEAG